MTILMDLIKKLPEKPGVYQFLNSNGEIIYVGKAKNLRKRVSSYFIGDAFKSYKHNALVNKIVDLHYILVENESEALLLENNLIKELQPRYNILLKDDKTYPWICIKNERFPRVFSTRNYIEDGSAYFGPYTSGIMVKTLLELIRQLYKTRTCNLLLCEENISKMKYHRCLEFQLGNCLGPCEGLQNEAEYNESIQEIREILKGNIQVVIRHLYSLMKKYAENMQFEEANLIKNKITILEKFKGKSTIVNPKINDVDVFSMIDSEDAAYINFIKVVQGAIVQSHNLEVVKRIDEEPEEILSAVIFDLRKRFSSEAPEIMVPFKPSVKIDHVKYTVPVRGDKLKLMQLSQRNAASYKTDILLRRSSDKRAEKGNRDLEVLRNDLRLQKLPLVIECFDNSNIQGTNPVASCVVFKDGKPFKSAYRHFNIKTVTGPDDFASMAEVVFRRYRRILDEGGTLPDLIIIDGGKGQLNAAVSQLKNLEIYGKVSIIGIAKRLEEIYVPDDPIPLYIDKNSYSLRLIQRIRDEAHRFGITFHRQKRSKSQIESIFDKIPGIGEKTRERILKSESDIEKLKSLNLEQLQDLAGKKGGKMLLNYFNSLES